MFVAVESDVGYEVYGSGDGRDGLLGLVNPSEGNRLSPVPIGAFNGKRIVSLSSGDYFLLALARSDADTTPPAPVSLVPDGTNAYVDVTFDEGVYGNPNGGSGLWAGDFKVEFSANGGGATGARVTAVRLPDGETPEEAGMPVGGETTLRLFLAIDGESTGVEEVKILPAHRLAIFDAVGTPMEAETELGSFVLTDLTAPSIVDAARSSDTEIVVTFSEDVVGLDEADPADFLVVETGSDGSVEYEVTNVARGADDRHAVLTVSPMATSGKEGVTLLYTPGVRATIEDPSGHALAATEPEGVEIDPWDTVAPGISSVTRVDDVTLSVTFTEAVEPFDRADDGGFAVKETGDAAIAYAVTAAKSTNGGLGATLTVADLGPSAKEGVTVTYTASGGDDGNGLIRDIAGNPMGTTTTGVKIDPWDTEAPMIETSEWDSAAAYVDITFSEGVYSSDDGTGALTADDFAGVFAANGGSAEGASVSAVRATDGETADTASLLTGGETTVRVFLSVEGTPSGVETVKVTPANGASIFDLAGNSVDAAQSTPAKRLPDRQPPVDNGGESSDEPAAEPVSNNDPIIVPIIVNGVVQEGMASSVTDVVDDRRVTSVKLDEQKLDERLAEEEAPTVTVAIQNGSDAVKVELSGRMVQSLEMRGATLEVEVESAAYRIPAGQIDIVGAARQLRAETALEDIFVFIDIVNVPADELPEQAETGVAFVAPVVEFRITAVYGDRTVEIDGFTAYVERSIGIPEGEDRSRITTGVQIGPDGELMHVPTRVVERNGSYVAIISSLTNSPYSVIYNERTFVDLTGHWAKATVEDMAGRLIAEGSPSGLFEPERAVTRAEFAAMTVRALGLDDAAANEPLARDVRAGDWFAGAVASAERYGLVQGEPGGMFRPNDTITRQETMVIVARAAALAGLAAPADPQTALAPFADASDVAAWARDGAALAAANGIVHGSDGWLAPLRELTRAEAAAILQRLLQTANLIDS